MTVVGEAVVRIRADVQGVVAEATETGSKAGRAFSAAFNRGASTHASKELGQVERGALAGSSAFTHLGRSLAFASGAFLGTAKAVDVVRSSIASAADEQKQLERANSLFKDSSKDVKTFADGAAKSLGLSSGEALKFANNIGQMVGAMKLGPKRTEEISVEMTKLAANLASMRNEDPSNVMTKLTAALRGRGAGLKAYGIVVNDTTIKEEALRLGLVKNQIDGTKLALARDGVRIATAKVAQAEKDYGANTTQVASAKDALVASEARYQKALAGAVPKLDANQKSIAAVNIITREGAKYQGEFAAHSGDLANKERVLHAEIENLKSELGTALLPMVTKVITAMTDWLGKTQNQQKATKLIHTAVKDLGIVVHDLYRAFQIAKPFVQGFIDALGGVGNALKLVLAYKLITWVSDVVEPMALRASTAWKSVGTAAETSAAETQLAARKMSGVVAAVETSLGNYGSSVKTVGGNAETAAGKVGKLQTGLGNLGKLAKIAIPVAIVTQVTDKNGSPVSAAIQAGLFGLMFGGPEVAIPAAVAALVIKLTFQDVSGGGGFLHILGKLAKDGLLTFPATGLAGIAVAKIIQKILKDGATQSAVAVPKLPGAAAAVFSGAGAPAVGAGGIAGGAGRVSGKSNQAQGLGGVSAPLNRQGASVLPIVIAMARRIAFIFGSALRLGAGTQHNQFVSGTNNTVQSDHWTGKAVDIPMLGSDLVRLGQAALIAAGADPKWARQQSGGLFNVGGWQIIFNTVLAQGGDHTNHLHLGWKGGGIPAFQDTSTIMAAPGLGGAAAGATTSTPTTTGGGGGGGGGDTGGLTVGHKAKAHKLDVLGQALINEQAAIERAVTRAKARGGLALVSALQDEIALDNKIISTAEAFGRKHADMRKAVDKVINQAKADIARSQVQIYKAYTKEQTHESLVRQVVLGLGLPDSVLATRAAEYIYAQYEKLTDAALKAKLRQQQKLKQQLAGVPVSYVDICQYCAEVCQDGKRASAVAKSGFDPDNPDFGPVGGTHTRTKGSGGPSRPPDRGPLSHSDRMRQQHARDQAHRDGQALRTAQSSNRHLAKISKKLDPARGASVSTSRESARNLL